jgi:hypothetical protein
MNVITNEWPSVVRPISEAEAVFNEKTLDDVSGSKVFSIPTIGAKIMTRDTNGPDVRDRRRHALKSISLRPFDIHL